METQTTSQALIPASVQPYSVSEILISWNNGDKYRLPYFEIRFQCPCASCVDENTGERILKRESIQLGVRPLDIQVIGRYALQIKWSDGHNTGMYHFDRLFELCRSYGELIGALA